MACGPQRSQRSRDPVRCRRPPTTMMARRLSEASLSVLASPFRLMEKVGERVADLIIPDPEAQQANTASRQNRRPALSSSHVRRARRVASRNSRERRRAPSAAQESTARVRAQAARRHRLAQIALSARISRPGAAQAASAARQVSTVPMLYRAPASASLVLHASLVVSSQHLARQVALRALRARHATVRSPRALKMRLAMLVVLVATST